MQVTGMVQEATVKDTKKPDLFFQRLKVNNELYGMPTRFPVPVKQGDTVQFDFAKSDDGRYNNITLRSLKVLDQPQSGQPSQLGALMSYLEKEFREVKDLLKKDIKPKPTEQEEPPFDDDIPY